MCGRLPNENATYALVVLVLHDIPSPTLYSQFND